MPDASRRAIAIVGLGAILPDAPDVASFWDNVKSGRYSIRDVPPGRWDPTLYYDPDPQAPDKTYSKIGGWVQEYDWDPIRWKLPIPPRVADAMDDAQKWGVACVRAALADYGHPGRELDLDRTAVVFGNAMAGEKHYLTALRVFFPEFAEALAQAPSFGALPPDVREAIARESQEALNKRLPGINEDTMPGELANCLAGRVANLMNLHGPNFVTDAACASALAAIDAASEGLLDDEYDAVLVGGLDRNMGAPTFVKFCKIGALSATGTRPYADGADGFVMGEGAVVMLLKRLADAERAGDKIYAVLRGVGGSSDGKGKGITAPNPVGQKFAIERAWRRAGLSPKTATLFEGHGTSTRVGDVVEVESLGAVLSAAGAPAGSIALGSVKSNIGHLKGAAGAAGILKAALALHEKVIPPSINFDRPNPKIDFANLPLFVNAELRPWDKTSEGVRRAGVSAFGFGGTNFHCVLEEYVPGRIASEERTTVSVPGTVTSGGAAPSAAAPRGPVPVLDHAVVLGAADAAALAARLEALRSEAAAGRTPSPGLPAEAEMRAPLRVGIQFGSAAELAQKAERARKALGAANPAAWRALRPQGVFHATGASGKVAFLYTGQGSQYANMLRTLRATEPEVAETFAEADRVMTPILGRPLSEIIFVDPADAGAMKHAEEELRRTEITQPAVLATDIALTRLLARYGITPDFVMGHSLGEYAALVVAGALPFDDALVAVAARGRTMASLTLDDNGWLAAVFAPLADIERVLREVPGHLEIANINSRSQAVIGGSSEAVERAMAAFQQAGMEAVRLPVSHAFHTRIVAPVSEPLRETLAELRLAPPRLPILSNVTGEFYPTSDAVPQMLDLLARQVASPVQFVKGLETLYGAGARVFVEVGPKKALHGFVEDVLGSHADVLALFTNHPKVGDVPSFEQALCGLYTSGHGVAAGADTVAAPASAAKQPVRLAVPSATQPVRLAVPSAAQAPAGGEARYAQLGHLFAEFLDRSRELIGGSAVATPDVPVAITGAALGLPGTERVFDDGNVARILRGEQFIDVVPTRLRQAILEKHITRLVKRPEGTPSFDAIDDPDDVIRLAARAAPFDLGEEFGLPADRILALDIVTQLAIGVGLDALRDAGIPLIRRYRTTSKGTWLPEGWALPAALRDDTGIIFGSAFPGLDAFADELARWQQDRTRREEIGILEGVRARAVEASNGAQTLVDEIDRRLHDLRAELEAEPYEFDRRFLFRVLAMGHSQLAEWIGARGPNTHVNTACASTTHAVSLAEDWIRAGRCRRVLIVAADDVTSDHLMEWMGAGFLATGAAATDDVVEEAAVPFDRRRHGMIMGMGAAALVVESADAVRERGLAPIAEVLATETANSAFHGTRLDVDHISQVMEHLLAAAEARSGIDRQTIAAQTLFVSHETYTPARGGSAAAEVHALRHVFGPRAQEVVVANTKGFTGHPMGAGIEDVVAVKALETGVVPPVANFREPDPELGTLHLSQGGSYPVEYALRLGAGFGSQIAMTLIRRVPPPGGVRPAPDALGFAHRIADRATWQSWLDAISGHPGATIEVEHRTLRVKDEGPPAVATAPVLAPRHALVSDRTAPPAPRPAPPVAVPAPVVSAPAPQPPPIAPTAAAEDEVRERVLAVVAEKTGYPRDMLDLDLDLEADLGIDTVKQAEVFASIREAYDIPRDDKLRLRDFPTLAHVIGFVRDRRPDLAAAPAATAAATTQTPAAAPSADGGDDEVRERVLAVVAEKTGYPRDMLDLDLDLEADLGIDTVKQAEVFASIREAYGIPRDDKLRLRDFPTLAHVIGFVRDRRPDLAAAPAATAAATTQTPAAAPSAAGGDDEVRERVLAVVAEKTGYPKDMLDLDLDLEADLGIDTVKQAEVFASIREAYDIPRDDKLRLRDFPTLAHVIGFVRDRRPDLAAAPAAAAAATTQPPAAPTGATPAAGADDEVRERVLAVVADKTGYPKDMLDLDLDLEADLGIDTVKQAEVFASVREAYGIPRDDKLRLRDFPTLAHVIGFVRDRRPDQPAAAAAGDTAVAADNAQATKTTPAPARGFEAAQRVPRRVPVPVLRPALELCKPTGVTLGEGSRVIVAADRGGVADALTKRLQAQGVTVLPLAIGDTGAGLEERVRGWLDGGGVHGVYWLPALDDAGPVEALDPAGWREALALRAKRLYTVSRLLWETLGTPANFLLAATRLGGQHGYDAAGALEPLGGAVTGLVKALKRERPDALVKAVDFAEGASSDDICSMLMEETLRDPGAVEIGRMNGLRCSIGLEERAVEADGPGLALGPDSVFVVTGAAGSIVSAIVADLAAAAGGGRFHLIDRVAEPDPKDPDLQRFASDRDGLKRDIFERLRARGERATPALVERELAGLERARAALDAIEAVQRAGGSVRWHAVDLLDAEGVGKAAQTICAESAAVDVLLHAGGLEISRLLPDKEPAEFDRVFDVKSNGWFHLMHGLGAHPLRSVVVFSSIAGRFGNGGQTDYSAANDLLCKSVSHLRRSRPDVRGLAVDWTGWAKIGMAARGSIPTLLGQAGIDLLDPDAGIPWIRRELTLGSGRGEVLVAGSIGILGDAWDADGGLDPAALDALGPRGPLLAGAKTKLTQNGVEFETCLDPAKQPFLDHHRIEGTPVLPGVMGVEGFAEAAAALLPGWRVTAVEGVRFLAPFKFYRDEPREVILRCAVTPEGDALVARCELLGRRTLAGQSEPTTTVHFTGRVRLGRKAPRKQRASVPTPRSGRASAGSEDVYRLYFHGPAYRVIDRVWREGPSAAALLATDLPPNHTPPELPLLAAPRLVEACFQVAGLWEMAVNGRLALPEQVDSIGLLLPPEEAQGWLFAVATPDPAGDAFGCSVVDASGRVVVRLRGYRTVPLPGALDPDAVAPLGAAFAVEKES